MTLANSPLEESLDLPIVERPLDEDIERFRAFIEEFERAGERRLPPELRLSMRLGVSRGRLRTILKHVEEQGLIWRHVGKGTFIGPRNLSNDASAIVTSLSPNDFFDARLILEPSLAAYAARHATLADIQALENCIRDADNASNFIQFKRIDEKLHRTIAEATHNSLLVLLYDTLCAPVKLGLEKRMEQVFGNLASSTQRGATYDEHRELVDAISNHDSQKAAELMRKHIVSVRTSLFGTS